MKEGKTVSVYFLKFLLWNAAKSWFTISMATLSYSEIKLQFRAKLTVLGHVLFRWAGCLHLTSLSTLKLILKYN